MPDDASTRSFSVHALDDVRGRHTVAGASFEDAAVAFVELWSPAPDAEGDVSVMVTDLETGARHCLRVDLGSGEAEPCG